MNRIAKFLFILVGCIFPILIGSLHSYVHFTELTNPKIKEFLQKDFVIMGESQMLWNTLGVVSVMMGISFIVIGLLNISILRNCKTSETLPLLPIFAMIFYLLSVIFVGNEFDAAFQFYGGIFGLLVIIICLIFTLKAKSNQHA